MTLIKDIENGAGQGERRRMFLLNDLDYDLLHVNKFSCCCVFCFDVIYVKDEEEYRKFTKQLKMQSRV